MAQRDRLTARVRAVQAYHDCNGDVRAAAHKLFEQGVLKERQEQFVRGGFKGLKRGADA